MYQSDSGIDVTEDIEDVGVELDIRCSWEDATLVAVERGILEIIVVDADKPIFSATPVGFASKETSINNVDDMIVSEVENGDELAAGTVDDPGNPIGSDAVGYLDPIVDDCS